MFIGGITKKIEGWFIPPRTSNYTFIASCDDIWTIDFSLTENDSSSPQRILTTTNYTSWRSFTEVEDYQKSQTIELEADKYYYMKIYHYDIGGENHMSIGLNIGDTTNPHMKSLKGWEHLYIEPHHIFEKFQITVANDTTLTFRLKFDRGSESTLCTNVTEIKDIFECNSTSCPCVSANFYSNATTVEFNNAIKAYFNRVQRDYGKHLTITRENLNSTGEIAETDETTTDVRFTIQARTSLSGK
jgi:hypothetical protein